MRDKRLVDATLTVPEAAFVAGLTVRSVNHEIDGRVIDVERFGSARIVDGADLLYLGAIRNLRTEMGPKLRRRLHAAIRDAASSRMRSAHVEHLSVALDAVENELAGKFDALVRLRDEQIESRPGVLAGEPAFACRAEPVRHVADMLGQGATIASIMEEFELDADQVAAAELFGQVSPRPGRPPQRKTGRRRVPALR